MTSNYHIEYIFSRIDNKYNKNNEIGGNITMALTQLQTKETAF